MSRQQNYDRLMADRKRLESLVIVQKELIRKDLQQMNHQLQPAFQLLNKLGSLGKTAGNNPLLSTGFKLGAGILLGGKLLRKVNPILKFGLPIAWQLISSNLFRKKNTNKV